MDFWNVVKRQALQSLKFILLMVILCAIVVIGTFGIVQAAYISKWVAMIIGLVTIFVILVLMTVVAEHKPLSKFFLGM